MRIVLILGVLVLVAYLAARQFDWLSPHSASRAPHAVAAVTRGGASGTCGVVADVRSAGDGHGPALFLDLGHPHPIESMQVVIPQADLGSFGSSPASWEGKRLCVSGPVTSLRGRPAIVARSPDRIRIE